VLKLPFTRLQGDPHILAGRINPPGNSYSLDLQARKKLDRHMEQVPSPDSTGRKVSSCIHWLVVGSSAEYFLHLYTYRLASPTLFSHVCFRGCIHQMHTSLKGRWLATPPQDQDLLKASPEPLPYQYFVSHEDALSTDRSGARKTTSSCATSTREGGPGSAL
jgi:hypothetical protein